MATKTPSTRNTKSRTKKIMFSVNPDAKSVRGKYRQDFVGQDNKPHDKLFQGELTKDGNTLRMIGEWDSDNEKFKSGCRNRTINVKHVIFIDDDKQFKEKVNELKFVPESQPVYDCSNTRGIAQLVFNKGEKPKPGRKWYVTTDHTR